MSETHDPTASDPAVTGQSSRRSASDESQIDQLLDQWEATYEAGEPVEVETLCSDHPELAAEVRRRVAALKEVDRKLAARRKGRLVAHPVQIGTTVDDLRFVNAGGLGEVFVGEDSDLHRHVAIKFMHSRLSADEDSRDRFALEAEVTGRLEHPGIVPLYGFGRTEDGRLFYAMRYIDGETLDDAIKRYYRHLDHLGEEGADDSELGVEFRQLLANFVSVCKTIAYAHNRGIVHRDIKPANVMLGRFGETIVVDWGLAVPVLRDERFKSSGEQTLMPSSGSSSGSTSGRGAGTPAFMSPEQASELAPTPASDIYSLGATLFKLLCNKPPVAADSLAEIRSNLIDGKLPLLNDLRSDVPKPLQAICEKAMALHPTNRYPTALELAHDVERYLADEPVSVCADTAMQRLMRFARRHRAAAQATLAGLCLCVLVSALAALAQARSAHTARAAEMEAVLAKQEAERATEEADKLRNRNLAVSAEFMARSIGQEIDRIWRVLEFEANLPRLRELVQQLNQEPIVDQQVPPQLQAPLQSFLERRVIENDNVIDALFVLSADGTQVARAPAPRVPQFGMNFSYRDYYTGIGRDLDHDQGETYSHAEPLVGKSVHMSAAYKSTLQGEEVLKVTFTVPIWDDFPDRRGRRVGVIGTSAKIGTLTHAVEGTNAWLVDMRENELLRVGEEPPAENQLRGLLLQHPRMNWQAGDVDFPRLVDQDIEALLPLVENSSAKPLDYRVTDPLAEAADEKPHSAIKAITIDGRGRRPYRTQWLVVAVE